MGQGQAWGTRGPVLAAADTQCPADGASRSSSTASEASQATAEVIVQHQQQQVSTDYTAASRDLFQGMRPPDRQEDPDLESVLKGEAAPAPRSSEKASLPRRHETGTAQTCVLIVKSFLGGAFLFLPHAVRLGGMVLSVCTMVFVFLVAVYCVHLLLRCCALSENATYERLGEKAFGIWGRLIIEVCVMLSQLSFCTINAVVVWGNLRDVIWTVGNCSPTHKWSVNALLWLGAIYFVPASLITNLKWLAPLMLVGNIGMAVGVLMLLVAVSLSLMSPAVSWTTAGNLASWENWPIIIGTSIFLWEGKERVCRYLYVKAHAWTMGLDIEDFGNVTMICFKVYTRRYSYLHNNVYPYDGRELLSACLGSLLALYVGYSLFCIAVFGSKLKVVILANLQPGPLGLTVQTVFALAVMATYPLLLFPASAIAELRLMPDRKRISARTYVLLQCLLRMILVLITLLAATVGLKQLDSFVALVGSLFGAPLTFLFPSLLHVRLQKGTPTLVLVLNWGIIFVGTCILVFSIYWTIATWRGTDDFPSRCGGNYA